MSAPVFNPTSIFFTVFILGLSCLGSTGAQKGGFTVELIHRDSQKSPFYNALETPSDRVTNALRRSFNRVHRFRPSSVSTMAAGADLTPATGEYLMNISIGTPAFDIFAIADTGSDLIWTQCEPCPNCFHQDAPLFNPRNSSTFRTISCSSNSCVNLDGTSCSSNNTCQYSLIYGDNSSTLEIAADTLTLPSTTYRPVTLPRTIFGCGHKNKGTFEKTSGIIGLGGGDFSLVSQLGSFIDGKFSYCLLPISKEGVSSKMHFGSDAIVSGSGVVSTPLAKKSMDTSYFLTLEAITVGANRIEFTGSTFGPGDGNIVIDSGTQYTLLPEEFYSEFESAVSSQTNARRVTGPQGLNLCFDTEGGFEAPDITVHFSDADVKLQPLNTLISVSETVSCFTFSAAQDFAIYGNLVQMDFMVGFDTKKRTVSFKPTDCSKH